MAGDRLCFDLTDPIVSGLRRRFAGDAALSGAIDTLEQRWRGPGPTRVSERTLKQWASHAHVGGPAELRLSVAKWLPLYQEWLESEKGQMEIQGMPGPLDGQPRLYDSELPLTTVNPNVAPGRHRNDEPILYGQALMEYLRGRPDENILTAQIFPFREASLPADRIVRFGMQTEGQGGQFFASRFCPFCGAVMPPQAGCSREVLAVVLGRAQSGKSSAIAACADYFLRRAGREGCGIRWVSEGTNEGWDTFCREYLEPYWKGHPLDAAGKPAFSVSVVLPVTEMTPVQETLVLTIAELSLDDENPDKTKLVRQRELCANADFAFVCADGRILRQKDAAPPQRLSLNRGRSQSHLLRQCGSLFSDNKNVCAAFVLAKSDEIQRTIRSGGVVPLLYRQDYRLDAADGAVRSGLTGLPFVQLDRFHRRACILRGYLQKRLKEAGLSTRDGDTEKTILNEFEDIFPRHTYFSIAGYGFDPSSAAGSPASCRAEWLLLWMLAVCGDLMARDETASGFSTGPDAPDTAGGVGRIILDNLCMSGECNWDYQPLSIRTDSPF